MCSLASVSYTHLLVLVVTNNQFAYSTPNVREFGEASLADRGRGYGFTVHETDGTDAVSYTHLFRLWRIFRPPEFLPP